VTLQVIGKIAMQDPTCEKCGTKIQIWKYTDTVKCKECGASYKLIVSELHDLHIDYEFEFAEFRCVNVTTFANCDNICPAPEMYCKEHVSDVSFDAVKSSINYAVKRLSDAKDNLERMEESKKIYLIQEVSGINGQDDSIREDKNGED